MNKKQCAAYDKTVAEIRDRLGSHHTIAVLSYEITGQTITGETIRQWMTERRVPTDFVFVLYELMNREIDPMTLMPLLTPYVEMKGKQDE